MGVTAAKRVLTACLCLLAHHRANGGARPVERPDDMQLEALDVDREKAKVLDLQQVKVVLQRSTRDFHMLNRPVDS